MNQIHNVLTREPNSELAGRELAREMRIRFDGGSPDAIVLFASAKHDYPMLLRSLADEAGTEIIAGASSAGEFTQSARGEGIVSAMALRSSDIRFSLGVGRNINSNVSAAAAQVVSGFRGMSQPWAGYRSALVMADALAGHTDSLVAELTLATGGNYRFFGGGAGDDGQFNQTHVFAGRDAISNGVVALEMLSTKPVGIGVSHGWEPVGPALRVTQADGMTVVSLNGAPAVEAFKDHARHTGQDFKLEAPLPYFLHNVLGIKSTEGYRLRVPLGLSPDGSVSCAAAIPEGAIVHIMQTNNQSAVLAARKATSAALASLGGHLPAGAFVFDCVATRLRLGRAFDDELAACAALLGPGGFVGCNTYGQIARSEGQFGGFHNCTAVVCVLPQ